MCSGGGTSSNPDPASDAWVVDGSCSSASAGVVKAVRKDSVAPFSSTVSSTIRLLILRGPRLGLLAGPVTTLGDPVVVLIPPSIKVDSPTAPAVGLAVDD